MSTMADILSAIGSIGTTLMNLLTGVVNAVTSSPILAIGVVLSIAFAGIGIFKRLAR